MLPNGFFSREEVGHGHKIQRLIGCGACGLNKNCITPSLKAAGKGEKGILIISEIPCDEEDRSGRLMRGSASDWLKSKLKSYGIRIERDCKKIAAVSCRTPNGRAPTSNEITMCRPTIWKEIDTFKPETILLLGNAAVESFLGERWAEKPGGINKWRGWVIPDRKTQAWVAPLFHPSYVLRSTAKRKWGADKSSELFAPVVGVIFDQDLERALSRSEAPFPVFKEEEKAVEIILNPNHLLSELTKIKNKGDSFAFDFETTGLKPHAPGHKIISCAVSTTMDHAISFLMPERGPAVKMLRQLFSSRNIRKRAHNINFESHWAKVRYRTDVLGWEWDSMIAAHMLDNRTGITGLKFQVYVNFGVIDYAKHMKGYLESSGGPNGINRAQEAPVQDLLMYNGLDALFQFGLSEIQMPLLKQGIYS